MRRSDKLLPGPLSRLRVRLMLLMLLALLPILGLVVYTAAEQRSSAMEEARASALRMVPAKR